MNNSRNHTPLLICALAMTVFMVVLYAYMYHTVGVSTRRAVEARDIVKIQEDNKGQEKEIIDTYDRSATDRQKLPSFFVPEDNVVAFIDMLELIGNKADSNLALSSISTGSGDAVQARVEVSGTWSAVMRSLMLAEATPYAVSISSVRLDAGAIEGSSGSSRRWNLTFDISAPFIPKLSD